MLKKGTMFGLDARVALAVIGSLSVISGASLYSAIKDAQSTAILADMKEIGKAWQQYNFDTARDIYTKTLTGCTVECAYKIEELVDSSRKNWHGPYLKYVIDSEEELISGDKIVMLVKSSADVTWGASTNWKAGECTAGRNCSVWSVVGGYDDDSLFAMIDEAVDSGDGPSYGSFRWVDRILSYPIKYHAYLEISPVE